MPNKDENAAFGATATQTETVVSGLQSGNDSSVFRRVGKNSFVYSTTNIFQKGISFFLIPLYTHYLSPTDYGILAVVSAINTLIVIFFTLSLHGAMTRYYFEYKDDPGTLKEFWGTILATILLISIMAGTALLLFGSTVLKPITGNIPFWPYVALGIAATIFQPFFTIFLALLQTQEQAGRYAAFSVGQFLVNLLLVIGFVIFGGMRAEGPLVAALISAFLFFLICFHALRHEYTLCLKVKYLKPALAYSLPLVPHSLTAQALSVADRLLLNNMVSTASAGLYNIGFMFSGMINIITDSVNRAYVPVTMEILKSGEPERLQELKEMGLFIVSIYCLLASFISFFSRELIGIFTTKLFHGSYVVIPYLAFTFVLNGIYYIFVNILFFVPRGTKYVTLGTAVGAVANIVLNVLLIPLYGLVGAALATLIAQLVSTIVVGVIGKSFEPIMWDYLKIIAATSVSFGVSVLMLRVPLLSVLFSVILKISVYCILLFAISLLSSGDPFMFPRQGLRIAKRIGRIS